MMDRNNMNLIPSKSIHNSVRFDDDFPKGWRKAWIDSQERCAGFRKSDKGNEATSRYLSMEFDACVAPVR
jgi:hypothetical protein